MSKLFGLLSGKKTYVGLVATGILGFAHTMGWINEEQVKSFGTLALTFLGVGLVHKGEKLTVAIKEKK